MYKDIFSLIMKNDMLLKNNDGFKCIAFYYHSSLRIPASHLIVPPP